VESYEDEEDRLQPTQELNHSCLVIVLDKGALLALHWERGDALYKDVDGGVSWPGFSIIVCKEARPSRL